MAVAGHTYEEIADALGYNSRQAAFADVKRGLAPAAAALRKEAEHFIAVQAERIEHMYRAARAVHDEYQDGDEYSDKPDQRLAAIDRMARASVEFRKLTGLDAPVKTENRTTLDGTVAYQVAVAPEELEQL